MKTRFCFVWSNVLNAPLWALYGMLAFILYKDFGATAFQLTLLISAKPAVSLFSSYWSSLVANRADRLKSNIVWAGLLGRVPSLFFPFVESNWYFIVSFALYFLSVRAVIPAWMEVLRLNLPREKRGHVFANGATASYLGGLLLPIFLGKWMDVDFGVWRWLFSGATLVSLVGIFLQARLSVEAQPTKSSPFSLVTPWRNCWNLLRRRPDFAWFQGIYLFGGLGLMVMQPALPVFSAERLDVSYAQLAIALSLCKGIGFAATTRFWAPWLNRSSPYLFCAFVTLLAALFPLLFLASAQLFGMLFVAYLLYGVMQAGSEMSWHLSGTLFAKGEDSSPYTSVNVLMVGLRGLVGPLLGGLLLSMSGPTLPLLCGALLCLGGTAWGLARPGLAPERQAP